MKVSCPTCDSKYAIADDKVIGRKVKVRCKSCGGQILVDGTVPAPPDSSPGETDNDDNDATRVFSSAERNAFDATHGLLDAGAIEPTQVTTEGKAPAATKAGVPNKSTANLADKLVWSVNVSESDERSLTTAQLVDAYLAGELEGEVFVWHDGMDDWKVIPEVPELTAAIEAKKAKAPRAKSSPKAATSPITATQGKASPEKSSPKAATAPTQEKSSPRAAAASPDVADGKPGETEGPKKIAPIPLGKAAAALKAKSAAAKGAAKPSEEAEPKATNEEPVKPAAAEKKTAARLATPKRPESAHDLFAAAGRKAEAEDIEVAAPEVDDEAKLGARHESSVLFSLDALKAGITSPQGAPAGAPKPAPGRKGPPVAPRKKMEDLMGGAAPAPLVPGMGPGTLLSSNQSLLTAPAPPPPKPEPVAVPATPSGQGHLETAAPAKKKGKLIALAVLGSVLVLGGGIAIGVMTSGSKKEASTTAASAEAFAKAGPTSTEKAPVSPTEQKVAADTKPAEAVASASAAASTPVVAAVGATPGKAAAAGAAVPGKASDAKTDTKKDAAAKKDEPSGPVSSGVASFNRESAVQALSVAASQTSSCKKPDGPTGTGKVQITFAPSGRVTTANVMGPPFAGTSVGGCVSGVFKRARVPAFSGDPVTVSKSFSIIP